MILKLVKLVKRLKKRKSSKKCGPQLTPRRSFNKSLKKLRRSSKIRTPTSLKLSKTL